MGICLAVHAVRHRETHWLKKDTKLEASQSSVDLDFVALCFTEICLSSTSPVLDEMRVKIRKDTSLKSQICTKLSGKRRLEEDEDVDVVSSSTKMETNMTKSKTKSSDMNENDCNHEQSTQSLNRKMSTIELCSPPKRMKNETMLISAAELSAFFKLFGKFLIIV